MSISRFYLSLAACVYGVSVLGAQGATLSIKDGTTVNKTGENYATAGTAPGDAAIYVEGAGSSLIGGNITATDGGFPGNAAVQAFKGGTIVLTDSHINSARPLWADGSGSSIVMNGGSVNSNGTMYPIALYVKNKASITLNDVAYTGNGTLNSEGVGSVLTINGGSVTLGATGQYPAISASFGGSVLIEGTKIQSVATALSTGAGSNDRSYLRAENFDVTSTAGEGLNANIYSTVELKNGTIHTMADYGNGIWVVGNALTGDNRTDVTGDALTIITEGLGATGAYANNAMLTLTNTDIIVNRAHALQSDAGAIVSLTGGSIAVNGSGGFAVLASGRNSQTHIDDVRINTFVTSNIGLRAYNNGVVTVKNSTITTLGGGAHGIYASNNSASISVAKSTINVAGSEAYGIVVASLASVTVDQTQLKTTGLNGHGVVFLGLTANNSVTVNNSSIDAQNGVGIVANGGQNTLNLKNSVLNGGLQLVTSTSYFDSGTYYGAKVDIEADNSQLTGGATLDDNSATNMILKNNSVWTLQAPIGGTTSTVTNLTLDNSSLVFAAPTDMAFQTLVTSNLNTTNANIGMNTYLNSGGAMDNQHTDRLLVNGDVTGTVLVSITATDTSPGGATSTGGNLAGEGISLIQVAGNAAEESFKLRGGYVTMNGLPYQYSLYAYGPGAKNGAADETQRLVDGTNPYWDYRLQSVYVEPPVDPVDPNGGGNGGGTTPPVKAVAPQLASYLVAPTALFQAGLMDISNLHSRLGEIRQNKMGDSSGQGEFFLRTYGGTYDTSSNRSALNYGYDADMQYAAIQAGGNLYAIETANSITRFGLSGSYGELSFEPKHVYGSEKNDINKWTVSAYATYLRDNGFYVDGIISYGGFSGDVSTSLRGKTAKVKGDSFAVSVETGMPFETGIAGLVIEPQAQLVYQRLMFDTQRDIDNFRVDLGDQNQWTARVGGRLVKTLQPTAQGRVVSVYGKLNLLTSFGDGGTVNFGDNFKLGDFGSAIEGGLGINAKMSENFSLYG
ncbi:autotransporter family protein, partial [Bartonella sp. LJL80]